MTAIMLKFPFKRSDGSGQVEVIEMRRPKVKDLKAANKGSPQETEVALFANLCELAPADLDEMDVADYKQLQDAYEGFLS